MIAGAKAVLLWALYLAILWAVLWAFGVPDAETLGLLGGAAVLGAATGAFALWRGRVRGGAPDGDGDGGAHLEPDLSVATAWTAISLATVMVSLVFGPWLALIGAAMLALGIGGLVRERRAMLREDTR